MADSDDFNAVVRVIERGTSLNELKSRGLVRLLLKQAGLASHEVTAAQLLVVGRTLLQESLQKNGIASPQAVLEQWAEYCTKQIELPRTSERLRVSNTVEEVFARMGLKR